MVAIHDQARRMRRYPTRSGQWRHRTVLRVIEYSAELLDAQAVSSRARDKDRTVDLVSTQWTAYIRKHNGRLNSVDTHFGGRCSLTRSCHTNSTEIVRTAG